MNLQSAGSPKEDNTDSVLSETVLRRFYFDLSKRKISSVGHIYAQKEMGPR